MKAPLYHLDDLLVNEIILPFIIDVYASHNCTRHIIVNFSCFSVVSDFYDLVLKTDELF